VKFALVIGLAGGLLLAKDTPAPAWAHDAARRSTKSDYPTKVATLVLLQEERLTVDADGKRVMTERGAIKILQPVRRPPIAFRSYNTKTGRIRDFHAWMLFPSGKETEFAKDRVLDVALSQEYTYDEGRAKMIECDPAAPVGSVFAYEVTEEEDTIFTTYYYAFQESAPVAVSRFVLSLPPAWESRGEMFNHAAIDPQVEGNTYAWELRDLPWIENEEYSPRDSAIAPRLGITYFPASASKPALRPLKDWRAVSAWLSALVDPPANPTAAVRARSSELTAASKNELDKIRAIAVVAQQINYVSVQLNLERGGGYTPHSADQVLSRNYGDCKDKATLMRALLSAAGIDSYTVVIFSGDRDFVRREWPSPMQFNHAIVAIKISRATNVPAIIEHPALGRLLIFDPTDPVTPVGDLPEYEQGSYALVIAGAEGDLLKMPRLPVASQRIERTVTAQLGADGNLAAHSITEYFGQSASYMRYVSKHGGADELKRRLEHSFTHRLGGVSLTKIDPSDRPLDHRLDLAVDFSVGQFGQTMQKLLIVKPGTLVPDPEYVFTNKERKTPVKLESRLRKDSVTIGLPAGFAVDEIPDPIEVQSPYGSYRASWTSGNGIVTFEQSLEVKDTIAPVSEYSGVRSFFDKLSAAQSAAAVLVKK